MATTFLPQGGERSLPTIKCHAPAVQWSAATSVEETCWNTSVNRLLGQFLASTVESQLWLQQHVSASL